MHEALRGSAQFDVKLDVGCCIDLVDVLNVIFTADHHHDMRGRGCQTFQLIALANLHILKVNDFDSNFTLQHFVPSASTPGCLFDMI